MAGYLWRSSTLICLIHEPREVFCNYHWRENDFTDVLLLIGFPMTGRDGVWNPGDRLLPAVDLIIVSTCVIWF